MASLTVNQFDCCNLLWRGVVHYGTGKTSYWPLLRMLDVSQCGSCHPIHIEYRHCRTTEEGCVVLYMELHFAVRLLIVVIALSYVLTPMLWHWREV